MQAVTYNLKLNASNSENYYNHVKLFTDEVLSAASRSVGLTVLEFKEYLLSFGLEEIREHEEYILELISFGVLWKSYSHKALKVKFAPFITLSRMAEWRKKHRRLKPYIDFCRGLLITLFLLPKKAATVKNKIPTLEQIDRVCKWFEATGEFREQALRFIRWRAFWGTKTQEQLYKIFFRIDEFTEWFEKRSLEALGMYTDNIENFLKNSPKNYKWREDRISCTRTRLEYHLNMVGAEILNRAYKSDYINTDEKVVLVPGCMRGQPEEECQALKLNEGLLCQGCLNSCNVNRLREMGRLHNFKVYIIPHASDLSLWSPVPGRPKLGVIASACVITLVEGGWELKRYNVPAQCVLLDCSGCSKHWRKTGISTELNIREFKRRYFNETLN